MMGGMGMSSMSMSMPKGMSMGDKPGTAADPFVWKEGVPQASVALWQNLQLTREQAESLQQFIRDAYRELRRVEEQATAAQVNADGKLEIRIKPVDNRERLRIEDQFWTKVDSLLDDRDAAVRNQRRKLARELISLNRFMTQEGVGEIILLWRSGTFFHWNGAAVGSGSGPELPSRLVPLWRKYSHLLEGEVTDEKKAQDQKLPPPGEAPAEQDKGQT